MWTDRNFVNDRLIRNLYDDLVMNHLKQVIETDNFNSTRLLKIEAEDLSVNRSLIYKFQEKVFIKKECEVNLLLYKNKKN